MTELNEASFCFGTFYGAIASGIAAMILVQIREANVKAGFKDRSLDKFPDSAQPNLTSSGIVRNSRQAWIRSIMFSILLVFFVGLAGIGAYYIIA